MSGLDFGFGMLLAAATAGFFYLGYYPWAILSAGLFFLVVSSITIFHIRQPQPRLIIGAVSVQSEEDIKEVLDKLDANDED